MLQPIQNEEQYAAAIKRAEALKHQQLLPDSPKTEELEMLLVLINLYEKKGRIVFLKSGEVWVNELQIDFTTV